mmetsp:Transcript_70113/g.111281  ORF Transcript_70113/g.111281 Transcript_70113/m.111281 type:complete len:241 (+) Transcript_70113:48-770(+)
MGGRTSICASAVTAVTMSVDIDDFPYPFESVLKDGMEVDPKYPGTAVTRLRAVLKEVYSIDNLDGPWADVRRQLLAAGGLKEDYSTSHAFNDDNHCDLTTMVGEVSHNSNADGAVAMISRRNLLGPHIEKASLEEHGPGGSWSTCTNGAHETPPRDVAHVQFSSRIAFKLVWVPSDFTQFVLVDDEGRELRRGRPTGTLPSLMYRRSNYELVKGGKYAKAADAIAAGEPEPPICDKVSGA